MFLTIIDLPGGERREAHRTDVNGELLDRVKAALARDSVLDRWRIRFTPALPDSGYAFELLFEDAPVLIAFLCGGVTAEEKMWSSAFNHATGEIQPPETIPWLATATLSAPGSERDSPASIAEAHDIQRCVAWALLD